jgi:hypothetical protein
MADVVWTYGASGDLQKIFATLELGRPGAGIEFVTNVDARLELLNSFLE